MLRCVSKVLIYDTSVGERPHSPFQSRGLHIHIAGHSDDGGGNGLHIENFSSLHIPEARKLALANYREEQTAVPVLPDVTDEMIPALDRLVENGLGVACIEKERLVGYLCAFNPWENAFGSTATGVYSPIHAHGAVVEQREIIYMRMYQAAAEKWVNQGASYHVLSLLAHDQTALRAMVEYGFGIRLMDAVRHMERLAEPEPEGITFAEIGQSDAVRVREMRKLLTEHLSRSPCFMAFTPEEFARNLARAEARDTRLFVAYDGGRAIAYAEIAEKGENFATQVPDMANCCGAYCYPEYRGKGVFQGLLNFIMDQLIPEGYRRLGTDFESFNPTANGFWLKYFTAYTHTVTRRIDECALPMESV